MSAIMPCRNTEAEKQHDQETTQNTALLAQCRADKSEEFECVDTVWGVMTDEDKQILFSRLWRIHQCQDRNMTLSDVMYDFEDEIVERHAGYQLIELENNHG